MTEIRGKKIGFKKFVKRELKKYLERVAGLPLGDPPVGDFVLILNALDDPSFRDAFEISETWEALESRLLSQWSVRREILKTTKILFERWKAEL